MESINNLSRNSNTLSWIAPFTLDLTGIDPDIVYYVEVVNITCGRSLLIGEYDVLETSYTTDAFLPGYIYEYTVTPRSNVEGARNGSTNTVIGRLLHALNLIAYVFTVFVIAEQFIGLNESAMGWTVSIVDSNRTNVILSLDFSHQNQVSNYLY